MHADEKIHVGKDEKMMGWKRSKEMGAVRRQRKAGGDAAGNGRMGWGKNLILPVLFLAAALISAAALYLGGNGIHRMLSLFGSGGMAAGIKAEAKEKTTNPDCLVGSALKYTANQLQLPVAGRSYRAYREALIRAGILKEGELVKTGSYLKREEAALLAGRLMDYLGEEEDAITKERIRKYGRISDLNKADEGCQDFVVRVFGAGIMVGSSDGKYRQSRSFQPKGRISQAGFRNVIRRVKKEAKRNVMSPDGQLIRTTNLPFNACEFDYILAAFPNSFYAVKFGYETMSYSRMPISPKDYAAPVDMKNRNSGEMIEEWKYEWADLIRRNYERKLNVDYRTIDDEWATDLAATYDSRYDTEANDEQLDKIKKYVQWAKRNHVVIESEIISVEPSTCYYDKKISFHMYLKFRIRSCDNYETNIGKVIFGDTYNIQDVKLNTWYGGIFGSNVSWYTLTPEGDTAGVSTADGLWTGWQKRIKTGLMAPVKRGEFTYEFDYIK